MCDLKKRVACTCDAYQVSRCFGWAPRDRAGGARGVVGDWWEGLVSTQKGGTNSLIKPGIVSHWQKNFEGKCKRRHCEVEHTT
jgi:hypothetical protein